MSLQNCRDLQRLKKVDDRFVAKTLRQSVSDFQNWLDKADGRFCEPRTDFSTGKKRIFDVPKRYDKIQFKRLNRQFQRMHSHHRNAHGGILRRSAVTSANRHIGNDYVWTTDIKNCFPNINENTFKAQASNLGLQLCLSGLLGRLFLCRNRLPQGCPTSNVALNIFFWHMDYRMTEFCGDRKLCYTRMADDIVISGRHENYGERATRKLHEMIGECGLEVNCVKWASHGRQHSNQYLMVHSLNVANGKLELSPNQRERASKVAKRTIGVCRSLQLSSFRSAVSLRNQLHGWYHYSRQTQDAMTADLRKAIAQSDLCVRQRLEKENLSVKNWKWWIYPSCNELLLKWQQRHDKRIVQSLVQQMFEFAS